MQKGTILLELTWNTEIAKIVQENIVNFCAEIYSLATQKWVQEYG